jgi:putative two-component system response regulator
MITCFSLSCRQVEERRILEDKAKILVVCGASNKSLIETMLHSMEYQVIPAESGDEALQRVEDAQPNVVLLDIMMSGLDVFEVIGHLKEDTVAATTPIVMITSAGDVENRLKALEAGVDEFLTSPVDQVEMQVRLNSLLKVNAYNRQLLVYQNDIEAEVARRTQELTRAFEKIKIASLDTVYRLSRAAEYKDEDTGAHVERMSHYSSAIARAMGLDDEFVENILWAAPMHDIGKIGIPDNVLQKPGKLTDKEWEIMRQHTTIGSEILKDADTDFIILAQDIALSHHEKWNGSGYPQGLKGTDIPLAGRIVSLADVFDALTSERPYKKPFPLEKALDIIKEDSGSHFDPDVAEAFLSVEDEIAKELNFWKFMSLEPDSSDSDTDLSNLFGD